MDTPSKPITGVSLTLYSVIALSWAAFQIALPTVLVLNTMTVRSIHLAFALALSFVSISPAFIRKFFPKMGSLFSLGIALLASVSVLYLVVQWEGIASRAGIPSTLDLLFGIVAIVVLLEATRRNLGLALPLIVLAFTLYMFVAPYMPTILAFKGASFNKYVTQVSLSAEGIYGIPLGISASVVFLFVLLGALLEKAGAGQFFIDLSMSLFGRYRGGPAKAAVAASGLMGTISGSSIANIVTTGTFTIPLMKKVGYPAKKAAAIEVAASTDGQLMPPIMGAAAFIIAEYVNIPYYEVVKAAIIPALASSMALMFITHIEALKAGIKGLVDVPHFRQTLKSGLHYLVPIMMLMSELFIWRHSPALAAVRTIFVLVAIILYQEIILKKQRGRAGLKTTVQIVCSGCIAGSKNMVPVSLACASAGIVVGLVNIGLGGMITQVAEVISGGNIFLLLVITAIASLILGMGLPTTATYIVMASLTAPIIVEVGGGYGLVIPLIAAHLFCFYFGILADDTPPVGLAAYAAAGIAGTPPMATCIQGFLYDIRTAIIPFMFMFNTDILLFGIQSWWLALLILVMTVLGTCAFASVIQGWFIVKNHWLDTVCLLLATLVLLNPKWGISWGLYSTDDALWVYLLGIFLLVGVYIFQRKRQGSTSTR